jgi:hypothetical protein
MNTKTIKFKVGDLVRIKQEPLSRFNDYLADIQAGLADRDIATATANRLEKALFAGEICEIVGIEANDRWGGYCVKIAGARVHFPWLFNAEDLVLEANET